MVNRVVPVDELETQTMEMANQIAQMHPFALAMAKRAVNQTLDIMLDLGINRAVNLAVAALDGCGLPGDISATDRYFDRDITEPFVLDRSGGIAVPQGLGIGVDVDVEAVASCTVESITLR